MLHGAPCQRAPLRVSAPYKLSALNSYAHNIVSKTDKIVKKKH